MKNLTFRSESEVFYFINFFLSLCLVKKTVNVILLKPRGIYSIIQLHFICKGNCYFSLEIR